MFTMSAREFNQSVARAQRIAEEEPVLITRRGDPAYVLLSVAEYTRLAPDPHSRDSRGLLELLDMPADDDGDDEFDRIMADIAAERARDLGRPPIAW